MVVDACNDCFTGTSPQEILTRSPQQVRRSSQYRAISKKDHGVRGPKFAAFRSTKLQELVISAFIALSKNLYKVSWTELPSCIIPQNLMFFMITPIG